MRVMDTAELRTGAGALAGARVMLARVAFAGALACAGLAPVSIAGMQIGAGVALGALVLLRASGAPVRLAGPLAAPVLLLAGAAALSAPLAWLAGSPPLAAADLVYWRGLLAPLVLALALAAGAPGEDDEAPRRRALALVVVWTVAALAPAAVAWVQVRTPLDPLHALGLRTTERIRTWPNDPARLAVVGFFSWYTRLAHALTPVAALAGALAVLAPLRARTRLLLGGGALAAGSAVILTGSRSAWAGLGAGALVLAALAGRRAARLAVPLAVAAAVAAGAASPVLRDRLAGALSPGANADRETIWRVCGAVIGDHPLTGVGFGALPARSVPYYQRLAPDYVLRAWCHDSFVSAWAEGGPLLAAALAAWFLLLARGFLRARRATDALGRAAAAGALAALAATFVNALVHDVFWTTEPLYALGLALGAAAVLAAPRGGALSSRSP